MFETLSMHGAARSPAAGGAAQQLVLFLHGLGADGHDLIDLADTFADILPHAQFLSPHAPFHCDMAPMGRQWFSLQSRETAHMQTGIEAARPLLNRYIDDALTTYGVPLSKLLVIGFSQGTMMALHTLLTRPEPCAGIVGYSGAVIASNQFVSSVTARPPVCLIHGEEDMVVPFAALPDAEAALMKAQVPVEAHALPSLGHGIDGRGIAIARTFIEKLKLSS
jgi:phospholipase/carboxylesterase